MAKERIVRDKNIELSALGFNLMDKRNEMGWTQRKTAKALGISTQSYQNWENGITKAVKPENYEQIKRVFACEEGA